MSYKKNSQIGRKQIIPTYGCLGLVLYWYRKQGSVAREIALAFGLIFTPMYNWLKFGHQILLQEIQHNAVAKVKFLTKKEMDIYKLAIGNKYPALKDMRVAADGLMG